jgi:hypothetical protein
MMIEEGEETVRTRKRKRKRMRQRRSGGHGSLTYSLSLFLLVSTENIETRRDFNGEDGDQQHCCERGRERERESESQRVMGSVNLPPS